jgi:hypothetical protein
MGATRWNLQAQPKILKKSSKHQINQSEQTFSQENYVSYFKSVKEPKIRMVDEICRLNIRIGATRRILQAQLKIV